MRFSGGLSNITRQYAGDLRVTCICSAVEFIEGSFFKVNVREQPCGHPRIHP